MPSNQFQLLSGLESKPTEWLLPLWLPLGELSVLDGDPGVNKSSLTLDLAARVSAGMPMPDGTLCESSGVILLAAEDSVQKTLVRRLEVVGADLDRISVVTDLTIPEDLDSLASNASQMRAKLVIFDPVVSFLGQNATNNQKVRQALSPLRALAEQLNLSVVLVRHLTKSGGRNSLYRGGGSMGIIGAARSGILVAKDPEDPNMRVMCQTKSNLGPIAPSLLFEPVETDGVVHIEWRGQCDYTADDLLKPASKSQTKQDQAASFLLEALSDGPVEQMLIQKKAVEMGIAYRTVERAKTWLGIESCRSGFGPGSVVSWALPKDATYPAERLVQPAADTPPTSDGGLCEAPFTLRVWQAQSIETPTNEPNSALQTTNSVVGAVLPHKTPHSHGVTPI